MSTLQTRRFGGRYIRILTTKRILVADLSGNQRFQTRNRNDASRRGRELAERMLARDETVFTTNIVVVIIDDVIYVVDGFGRLVAANLLGLVEVEADIIALEDADYVALNANNKEDCTVGFDTRELSANAFLMLERGVSIENIQLAQGCNIRSLNKRLVAGRKQKVKEAQLAKSEGETWFATESDARKAALKAFALWLGVECETWSDLVETVKARKIALHLVGRAYENSVNRILVETLDSHAQDGVPVNSLIFFYLPKGGGQNGNTTEGHEAVERAERLLRGAGTICACDLRCSDYYFNDETCERVTNYLEAFREVAPEIPAEVAQSL